MERLDIKERIDMQGEDDMSYAIKNAKPISKIDLLHYFHSLSVIFKRATKAIKESDFYKG